MTNKLTVTDGLTEDQCNRFLLRIREDLDIWIRKNTKGSVNSVINHLIMTGIVQTKKELKERSIYHEVNPD